MYLGGSHFDLPPENWLLFIFVWLSQSLGTNVRAGQWQGNFLLNSSVTVHYNTISSRYWKHQLTYKKNKEKRPQDSECEGIFVNVPHV
jgi:hypothetical protein